ncbi:MAG: alpha/beta hydrolase [Vicinamibacterales bacterium]
MHERRRIVRRRGAVDHEPTLHSVRCLSMLGFHSIAVWEWGANNNGPPVICVHGLTRQGRDFDTLARRLVSDGRRVLCPDLPGRGRSDWLDDPLHYNLLTYANDMNTVLAWAHADPVDWVGTSLGGMVGMMLAAQKNNPIRRLVLNDVGAYVPSTALQRIGRYLSGGPAHFNSLEEAEERIRETLAPFGDLNDREWRHLTEHSFHRDRKTGKWIARHDPGIARTYRQWQFVSVDLWKSWRDITCPVLLLRGADSDFLLPAIVTRMRASGPPTEAVEIEGSGHVPSLTREHHLAPILEYLARENAWSRIGSVRADAITSRT